MAESKGLNPNIIKKMYEDGKSIREIANFFNVQHRSIQYHLERMNVKRRESSKWTNKGAWDKRTKPVYKETIEEILYENSKGKKILDILKEKNIKPFVYYKYKRKYFGDSNEQMLQL